MRWTDMVVVIVMMSLIAGVLVYLGQCSQNTDKLKLECLKLGKPESECRMFHN